MNYTLTNKASTELYMDLTGFLEKLEDFNALGIRILKDYHKQYSLKYKKGIFFNKHKMNFTEFLNAITFNTTLVVYKKGEHDVPFAHIRPAVYTWSMKEKKLARITGNSIDDVLYIQKNNIIKSICSRMYSLPTIRDVIEGIKRLDEYGTVPYTIDDNMVNLHKAVKTWTAEMQRLRGKL